MFKASNKDTRIHFFENVAYTDKVSNIVTFENTYLWVTFGKSSIFCLFMLIYLFLIFKIIL